MRDALLALLLACLPLNTVQAAVEGRVQDTAGRPVPGAWIYSMEDNSGVHSERNGHFTLKDAEPPLLLAVEHDKFERREVRILAHSDQPVLIELTPRFGFSEEITVTAHSPRADFSSIGAAASRMESEQMLQPYSGLVGLVEQVPGISENGQGGHLNVYSIRGVSGQRVRTSIGGIRLAGDRRAGVSASFLDPFLFGAVELTRGPSAVRHGSGALGGVVEILPRTFENWDLSGGYHSQGNQHFFQGGWGNGDWSAGFVRRQAGNSEAADGTKLNSHFTQYSALLMKSWEAADRNFQFFIIPALAQDIGKSNSDFPIRTTNYPRERHLLLGFSTESQSQWHLDAFLHPHTLETQVTEPDQLSEVSNNSFDFGAKTTKQVAFGSRYILYFGADYFARRSVDSEETREMGDSLETSRPLEGGEEDELGLHASLSTQIKRIVVEGGARFSWFGQRNINQPSLADTAWSGFAGVSVPVTSGLEVTGSVASGLRFPSLSERFFTGTTGRGTVVGNPGLVRERAANLDTGLRYFSPRVFAAGYFFYNRISDYIERVDLQNDIYSFANLTKGVIRGVEWESALVPVQGSSLYFRGHALSGEDDRDTPLADIPVHRFVVGFQRREARFLSYGAEWQYRDRKQNPGSGEQKTPSAHLLSAGLRLFPLPTVRVSFSVTNLLNELYFPTADRKAALAPGRGVGVSVNWLPD